MTLFTLFKKTKLRLLLIPALFAGICQAQTIRYVKPTGTGDGSSWDNASSDLQGMIDALGTDQVWVAAGTYKPTTGSDRTISFSMKAGVKIYGSFAGTETALSQRNSTVMAANKSILSGDLNNDDVITGSGSTLSITGNGENSYQIIFNNNNGLTVSNSLLDGFTITGGNANSSTGSPEVDGGGMYNGRSSPSISNVTFTGNTAKFDAGGMYNGGCSPSLTNVIFVRNSCLSSGGAIANHDSSPSLSYVTFDGNKGQFGGGIADYGSSSPSLSNVIFKGNNGSSGGGIFNFHTSSPSLINVAFSSNTSQRAGGIYNAGGTVTIKNTLFSGNTASISGPDILHISGSSTNISYSLLQAAQSNYTTGFNLGAGMLYAQNPLFVNAADLDGADNIFGTADDGLQLLPCSPAVNTGNNDGVASTDITGNPRTIGGTVDMGAYEYQGNAVSGTRIHVNATAAANGDGSSWATAYTDLQTALANARLCSQITEIWVAKGTYYPTTNPTDRAASFVMKNGVAIYGGFTGTETNLNDRNWTTNPTILSGDIDHATDPLVVTGSGTTLSITGNRGNSYHVIFNDNNGLTGTAVLDGFTITGGNDSNSGGGMYNNSSSPSLVNCSFSGNLASSGGGMYNKSSSPSLSNCSFSSNSAGSGGGMYNKSSSPSLMDCHFSGNSSSLGGGMANIESSSPSLVNCSFTGNYGDRVGGGMHNLSSSLSLTNCSFSGNKARRDFGGGMYSDASSLSLINCSFLGNQAGRSGGAMFNLDLLSSTFTNCIFLGNQAGGMFNWGCSPSLVNCTLSGNSGDGMINFSSSSPSLKNCILWGNSSEVANLDDISNPTYTKTLVKGLIVGGFQGTEDPLFVNQPAVGSGTAGDLRLRPCSPVLNAGNNADNTTTKDLDGNARIFNSASGGTIDLGAYEYQSALVITPSVSVNHPITCAGTNGSITLSGFLNSTTYSVTYKKNTNAVAAANFTSNESGVITLTDLGAGSYTDIVATYGTCVSNAATGTLTDPIKPSLTLSTIPAICAGAMSFTIPYTNPTQSPDKYSISGAGITGVTEGNLSNPITVNLSSAASGSSLSFTLTVKNNTTQCVSDNISGSVTIDPVSVGGTVSSAQTICSGTAPADLSLSGQTGNVLKWQKSTDAAFSSPVDIVSTATTLTGATIGNLTANTYFRAVVKSGVCSEAFSAAVLITILSPAIPTVQNDTIVTPNLPFSLRASGCSGPNAAVNWYLSSDNSLVSMPATIAAAAAFYARCQQSTGPVSCLSERSANLSVKVVKQIFVNQANKALIRNGKSWTTAFSDLKMGLDTAALAYDVPVEVWVAKGTYKPGTTRQSYFTIPSGVKVYGGFEATETLLTQRNPKTHLTTLSGEIGAAAAGDNTHHVVVFDAANDQTRIDGFRIQRGYAEFFAGNQNTNLTPAQASTAGGGILALNKSKGIVSHCVISDNKATFGGGILLRDSSHLVIAQTILWGNEATFGGGVYMQDGSKPRFENVLIVSNKGLGGGLYVNASQPLLIHCTIASNLGTNGTAGGIFNANAVTTLQNSILWGNSSPQSTNGSVITYSIVEGGFAGTGNLSQNPLFVSASPSNLAPLTGLGDYHLLPCSPAIDAANNADALPSDLDAHPRPFPSAAGIVDIGAYESPGSAGAGPATLSITEPITSGMVLKTAGRITATNQVSGATVVYQGSQSVTLLPGFSANGNTFQAIIGDCSTTAVSSGEVPSQK